MSASKTKHQRQSDSDRRSTTLYGTVIAIVAVIAVCLLVWNSGLIQRTVPAVEVKGEKYTAAEVQYYYNTIMSNTMNNYVTQTGMLPFDYNKSLKDQMYDEEKGTSWHDYFLDEAVKALTTDTALADKAEAANHKLSESSQKDVDAVLKDIDSNWVINGFSSRDAYIRANYGPYMTYKAFVELLNQRALASDYAGEALKGIQTKGFTDADYDAYYAENANLLDTFTLSQITFQASVPAPEKDKDGKAVQRTEAEQKELMDKAKEQAKADAEAFQTRLAAGEDIKALTTEFGAKLYNSIVSETVTGGNMNTSYSEWATDSSRINGDVTLVEYDGGTIYNYYVVRFEGRALDKSNTANVRHILVAAETSEGATTPTQEQYDAAKVKAEELLETWKSGPATEESFAALAAEKSADQGSASNGGLIAGIGKNSGFIPEFENWALDPARAPGQTGLVQNTGSSVKGWHIMYYVGQGEPVWKQIALHSMTDRDYGTWEDAQVEGYEAKTSMGLNFVQSK